MPFLILRFRDSKRSEADKENPSQKYRLRTSSQKCYWELCIGPGLQNNEQRRPRPFISRSAHYLLWPRAECIHQVPQCFPLQRMCLPACETLDLAFQEASCHSRKLHVLYLPLM